MHGRVRGIHRESGDEKGNRKSTATEPDSARRSKSSDPLRRPLRPKARSFFRLILQFDRAGGRSGIVIGAGGIVHLAAVERIDRDLIEAPGLPAGEKRPSLPLAGYAGDLGAVTDSPRKNSGMIRLARCVTALPSSNSSTGGSRLFAITCGLTT